MPTPPPPPGWNFKPPPGGKPAVGAWASCGGRNGPGGIDAVGATCPPAQVCVRADLYFWQCQPDSPGIQARLEHQAAEQVYRNQKRARLEAMIDEGRPPLAMWQVCGGINGPGAKDAPGRACEPLSWCNRLNQ